MRKNQLYSEEERGENILKNDSQEKNVEQNVERTFKSGMKCEKSEDFSVNFVFKINI